MKEFVTKEIRIFENYETQLFEYGKVIVSTQVVESSLNYHATAHGGYLFALSDQIAGAVCVSTGYDAVTQQSNINYLKAAVKGDVLTIEGTCIHDGRTSKVNEVTIRNQKGQLVTKASFTMFIVGKRKDNN
ncbi:PaaI family thioesterase [Streptococcus didelphis]|uniref:PaaI family thioesterase n=1 Tax=Streptococcus didelphis TaxID=102886 RepID=A0ABY9LGZ3_9STRE|nr:PaaI family thioesterase [Streptococcus didelphis]WMB28124.1 PaaI family thioesterase [Streptococcus didelphis]WMB30040.1 PaaI family thioesterase [Streptococcus didelphis]